MSKNKKILNILITLFFSTIYFSRTTAMENKPAPEITTKKDIIEITDDILQKYRKKIKEIKNEILNQETIYKTENIEKTIKDIEFINKPIIVSEKNKIYKITDINIENLVDQLNELKIKEKDETVDYFINKNSKKKLIDFLQSIKDAIKNEEKTLPNYLEELKKNNFTQKQITPKIIKNFEEIINEIKPSIAKFMKIILPSKKSNKEDQNTICTKYELSFLYDQLNQINELLSNQDNNNENKKNPSYKFLNFNEVIKLFGGLKLIDSQNPYEYYINKVDKEELENYLNNMRDSILEILEKINSDEFKKYNPNEVKLPMVSIEKYREHIEDLINWCKEYISKNSGFEIYCKQLKFCDEIKDLLFLNKEKKLKNEGLIEYLKKNRYILNYPNKNYYIDKADEEFITKKVLKYEKTLEEIKKNHDNQKLEHIPDEIILKYIEELKNLTTNFVNNILNNKNIDDEKIFQECDKLETILSLNNYYVSFDKTINILKNKLGYNNLNQKFYCTCNVKESTQSKLVEQIFKTKCILINVRNKKYDNNQKFNNKNEEIINLINQHSNQNEYTAFSIIADRTKLISNNINNINSSPFELEKFKKLFYSLLENIYLTPESKLDKFLLFNKITSQKNHISYEDFKDAINEEYEKELEKKYCSYEKIAKSTINQLSKLKENMKNFANELNESKKYFEKYLQEKSKSLKKEIEEFEAIEIPTPIDKEQNSINEKENKNEILNTEQKIAFEKFEAIQIPTPIDKDQNSINEKENKNEILNTESETTFEEFGFAPMPTPIDKEQNSINEKENKNEILNTEQKTTFEEFDVAPIIRPTDEDKNKIEENNLYNKPTLNNIENENNSTNNNSEKNLTYYINNIDPKKLNENEIKKLKDIIRSYEQNKNNQNKEKEENITTNYDKEKNIIENKNEEENKIEIKEDKKISRFDIMMAKINEKKIKNEINDKKQKNKNKKNKHK